MKRIYWRPQKISRIELGFIALVSVALLVAVDAFKVTEVQPWHEEKLAAARLAHQAMQVVRDERERIGFEIDPSTDPLGTGLIGTAMSEVTTNTGHLASKQTTLNPNFAAVIVHYLRKAGIQQGDTVAVGCSGSFPALNIAVFAALEVLKVQPVVIASASGSQWGANDPRLMWLDMERTLYEKHVFSFRSVAASRGGIDDRALGISRDGRQKLDQVIERNGIPAIKPKDYAQSVEERMAVYRDHMGTGGIKAYINVGGGTTSVGTRVGKEMFHPGLNRTPPTGLREIDSVMSRFIHDGVPVIHLIKVAELAKRFGLPIQPQTMPRVGDGEVFLRRTANRWLAGASVVLIFALLYGFIRLDLGFRMLKGLGRSEGRAPPERMV